MRILSLCLLCGLLFAACDGRTRERRAARGEDFVSDPDHLYFRNVRSRDYRSRTLEEGTDVYVHDDLQRTPTLEIRDFWLDDRAELRIGDRVLSVAEVRALRNRLRAGKADTTFTDAAAVEAATAVTEDYLRLIGG